MSDNNFEQSIRSKMDELSFHPSDDVWTKVEAELDHGKKRRRLWLWIPVAAALIGLMWVGIQYTEPETQHSENVIQQTGHTKQQAGENKQRPGSRQRIETTIPDSTSTKHEGVSNTEAEASLPKEEETSNIATGKNYKQDIDQTNSHVQTQIESNYVDVNEEQVDKRFPNAAVLDIDIERRNSSFGIHQFSTIPSQHALSLITNNVDKEIVQQKKKDQRKRTWNFYASGSAGFSGVNDGGLLDMRTALSDYSSPSTFANYGGGRGLTNNYAVILRPVSPGVYLNLQAGVERSVARKWSLGAALGYSRFSTSMKDVGWDKRTINLNYGLLDLPVTLSFNQPAYDINLGIVSSSIISYKVKQPETNSINIADKDDLNRLQFGLTAGADIRVFRKSNHQIKVGPTFRYQFTNLLENKISAQHLASGAIHLKWYLNKK